MQVKAIGKENLANKQQSVHDATYIFHVSVNIGEEIFGEWVTIHLVHQFFPLSKFSCVQYMTGSPVIPIAEAIQYPTSKMMKQHESKVDVVPPMPGVILTQREFVQGLAPHDHNNN